MTLRLPDQHRDAIDVAPVHRPEIPAVQAVFMIAEQENLIVFERSAALPRGQIYTRRRLIFGFGDDRSIHSNEEIIAANFVAFDGPNLLDDRPSSTDKSVLSDPASRVAFWRQDDPISFGNWTVLHPVKPPRRAVSPVPDKPRFHRNKEA